MNYIDFTNPATSLEYWIEHVAPNYFNFDASELHRTGAFGYVNDVMATTENDTAHAVSIARREFYPTTAKYTKSLYKMAALQQISYPFANPAIATVTFVIQEEEILKYAEFSNGRYKFVLDNTMVVNAGNIPFMIDYPIVIIAKPTKLGSTVLQNGSDNTKETKYSYTLRYDTTYSNSLNALTTNYIYARTAAYAGIKYLLFKIGVRQVSLETFTSSINKSPLINNITLDFPFSGKICGFEVFYSETNSDAVYQLKKIPLNGNPVNAKFCMYNLVDQQTLRLTFPENAYFTPKFNSNITVNIYTTLGTEGNFPSYKASLTCTTDSEKYPYNNMVSITGMVQGSSINGTDLPTQEDFRNDVIAAYATNKTITTANDLQVYFDSIMLNSRNKVIFRKKRDDVFERLYGAYMLLKDLRGFIVPANTVTLEIKSSQADRVFDTYGKAVIRPGKVLKYQDDEHFFTSEYNLYSTDYDLNTDINDNVTDFCYTNIFLMQIKKSPNAVGYYLNTVDTTISLDSINVNDTSYIQFALNSFNIQRNAIRNQNYYKLSVLVQPSIVNSELQKFLMLTAEECYNIDDIPIEIRAEYSGIVLGFEYINSSVFMVIKYIPDIPGVQRSHLTKYVQEPGMPTDADNPDDLRIYIRISAPVLYTEDDEGQKVYDTPSWYSTTLQAGDTFTGDSVIAYRKPKDTGILRVIGELEGDTFGLYIPFTLDSYDSDSDVYTFSAYLSTDDVMNDDGRLEVLSGFASLDGSSKEYVSIDPTNCDIIISTFIQYDDINYTHSYSSYDYLKNHTFTNRFKTNGDSFDFLTPMKFIRSTISYDQLIAAEGDTPEVYFRINEVPLVRSNWLKNAGNVFDLVTMIRSNYEKLYHCYDLLENNYTIDMKFFNTYGKSKFFNIGIKENMSTMYKVNIVLKFGVKLNALSPFEEFRLRFVSYIREYIESFNDVDNSGNSIYMMDLVADIKNNFNEIERLEYYGIDNYSVADAQNIESVSEEEINQLGYNKYIPEFINVYCDYNNNELEPKIDITILE